MGLGDLQVTVERDGGDPAHVEVTLRHGEKLVVKASGLDSEREELASMNVVLYHSQMRNYVLTEAEKWLRELDAL
jgi:hypothetical protein